MDKQPRNILKAKLKAKINHTRKMNALKAQSRALAITNNPFNIFEPSSVKRNYPPMSKRKTRKNRRHK